MRENTKTTVHLCLIKTSKSIFLLTHGDGKVRSWNDEQSALNYWEDAYKGAHARSYEGSMSACISFIMKQPSIIHVETGNENRDLGPILVRDDAGLELCTCRGISGGFMGFRCTEAAEEWWDKGTKPALIAQAER